MFVRVVTEQDVKKWLRSDLSPKEADVFLGLSYIKSGFDGHDEYTLMRGYEKLRPLVKGLVPPEEWEIELPTKNGSKISIRSGGGQKWNATHYNYSRLLTQMLKNTRFVMWCSLEKYHRFLPALFCRDRKTAVFAMRLAGPLRVCPNCDTPFVPAAGNINYHTLKCREAYRVRRFRWRAKQPADEATKGTKNPKKTVRSKGSRLEDL